MSFLLESILACAPDTPLDARDHWPLHEALRSLDHWLNEEAHNRAVWCTAGFPVLQFVKDPDVGWRASGVTRAIWDLVSDGTLICVDEDDGCARFVLKALATPHIRRELMHLSPECAAALQRTGHRFAQNATMAS
ncbi:hypothetical protein BTO20_36280 [Mycobacterium dioxanotrophicus]|uniref:Uncharacterized protein n=1 Tax=Mycobacterium dioxanotrophicus TaxID=482462 RepID=A0A1Y0CDD7_9MYCO|nr:hypothetical protein BTO20_36280 [Mycobacterium dioxanotrophicus]